MSRSRLSTIILASTFFAAACEDSTGPVGEGAAADSAPSSSPAPEPPVVTTSEAVPTLSTSDGGIVRLGALSSGEAAGTSAASVEGQYIIVFDEGVQDVPGLAQQLVQAHQGSLRHTYRNVLKGFAAKLPRQAAEALARHPHVRHVEPDRMGQPSVTQTLSGGQPWGIDRLDQRSGLSRTYVYGATGAGVNAYIIDTGLDSDHPQFGGRARNVATIYNDNGEDCQGHGTHVAGTVGGATYGVAKQVRLLGVKIGRCGDGWASTSDAIGALDWVRANRVNPAVANLSYGWPRSYALDLATNNLAASGVFISVAAGNSNANACNFSPAAAGSAFTTAASGSSAYIDDKAGFSNWGGCVDGYAPGYQILSSRLGGGSVSMNGTSMAAPHVAGVAALLKQRYGNQSSSWITNTLKSWATLSAIRANPSGTPNLLLYKGTL